MAQRLVRVKKAAKALRPGNARVEARHGRSLGPSAKNAVVDDHLHPAQVSLGDYIALRASLRGRHMVLDLEQHRHIDEFHEALSAVGHAPAHEMSSRLSEVGRQFSAALEEAASLIDRRLLEDVTLSPRLLALRRLGSSAFKASGAAARALHSIPRHVEDRRAPASVASVAALAPATTVTLTVFRPDLDRAAWERSTQGVFVMPVKAPPFIMPVTATSWQQGLGIWSFAIWQFAGRPVPEPFASFIARLRKALASNVDADGYGSEPEDKQRADKLVGDYPSILRQMQVYLEQLRAAEEREEGRAVRDAFARKVAAWMGALGAVAPGGVSEPPRQGARACTSQLATSRAPVASPIARRPTAAPEVRRAAAGLAVDSEIAALIPSPSKEELAMLESSLLQDGCLDPILVWVDGGRRIVVDGHTRLNLCQKNGLAYGTKELQFADRSEAIAWVLAHQLGRRNLTAEARAYLRGRLYNSGKAQGARRDLTSGQSDQKSTTAWELAAQYKVGEKTIRRDAHFAEQLDHLAKVGGTNLKNEVLTRGGRVGRRDVARIAALDADAQRQVVDAIRSGTKASAALQVHVGAKVETGRKAPGTAPDPPNVAALGPVLPPHYTADSLMLALSDSVAFLEQALLGSVDAAIHGRLFDLMEALEVQVMRHGFGPQKGE